MLKRTFFLIDLSSLITNPKSSFSARGFSVKVTSNKNDLSDSLNYLMASAFLVNPFTKEVKMM